MAAFDTLFAEIREQFTVLIPHWEKANGIVFTAEQIKRRDDLVETLGMLYASLIVHEKPKLELGAELMSAPSGAMATMLADLIESVPLEDLMDNPGARQDVLTKISDFLYDRSA